MKVQKKIKWVLPVILALTLFLSIAQVHAVTTYNWVQNPSFETAGGNQFLNAGFEVNAGDNYDNWTDDAYTVTYAHSGSFAVTVNAPSGYVKQSLVNKPILGSAISELSIWVYRDMSPAGNVRVTIYYNDSSTTVQAVGTNYGGWYKADFTSYVNSAKYVTDVKFDANSVSAFLDDAVLTSASSGQTTVSPVTQPWFNIDLFNWNDADGIATSGLAHSGICAYYYAGDIGYTGTFYLYQPIPMLYTNLVENCSFWAYESVAGGSVKLHVFYGDGTQSVGTCSIGSVGIWQQFNVIILPNRVIQTIALEFIGSSAAYPIYVDDVSLLATVPYGQSCFTWSVSPEPTTFGNWSFDAYSSESYVFLGSIHAANDTVCGTGTFSVTSTYGGVQTGLITNGVFNFPISARTVLLMDAVEDFIITINSDVGNFTVTIKANWEYIYTETTGGLPIYLPTLIYGIEVFCVLFIPPLVISILVRKVKGDAMVGFIAGLALSVVAGIITGVVPVWGLFIITLVLAYCIFAKVREK